MLERLTKEQKKTILKKVRNSQNIEWLAVLLTHCQMKYWYDPCGKSGYDISPHLSEIALACVKRIKAVKDL